MNKKLILLILLLPLLMMFSIFTSTNSVQLNVAVGVSKIEIIGSKYVYLDLDKNEQYYVNYAVYPVSAKNKNVYFSYEQVGSQNLAELTFEEGYIIPKSTGVAKVTLTTADGGFKDSFIVKVDALNLHSITSTINQSQIKVGKTARISTTFDPSNFYNKMLNYSSSNTNIATVSDKGVVKGVNPGSSIITISSVSNPEIYENIEIEVYSDEVIAVADPEINTIESGGEVALVIEESVKNDITKESITFSVYDVSNNQEVLVNAEHVFNMEKTGIVENNGSYKFTYEINNSNYENIKIIFSVIINDQVVNSQSSTCYINKMNGISAEFDKNIIVMNVNELVGVRNEITLIPSNADVVFSIKNISNANIIQNTTYIEPTIKAVKPGVSDLTIEVKSNDYPDQDPIELSVKVVVLSDVGINEAVGGYGYERMLTVGGVQASNNSIKPRLTVSPLNGVDAGDGFLSNIKFISNNENVKIDNSVENKGYIEILNEEFNDLVDITCVFEYEYQGEKITSEESFPITIRCIGNGVNVSTFEDLYNTVKQEKIVVLQGDIIGDFGKINGEDFYTEQTVTKIQSTYDIAYYENVNNLIAKENDSNKKQLETTVKVLLNFKNDIYGNGFEINANNVTNKLNSTGGLQADALFRGPLKFVSLSDSASSSISVNAQDNICYAVYDDVDLVNVTLKGCTLSESDGSYDLNDLTYTGTTVEVFGDNVSIKYSTIANGRTALRVFGDADVEKNSRVINLNISNSVLSCAREFLIRMGSNCFVDGTIENPAPYIDNNKSISFPAQKAYNNMTSEEKAEYDNRYIKTFVNLKDCILEDSGLFCIGIDSHFSGVLLENGLLSETWTNLAKTSYGAKLTIEGDVRMYDWKNINSINSDTLIETNSAVFEKYKLDVKELIDALATNTEKPNLNKIVYKETDGSGKVNKFVHGGIAFFGGGKNYGVADFKDYEFVRLNGYEVNLSDVNRSDLQAAAGNESFYFLLNDASISDEENGYTGFLPKDQEALENSSNAYAPIYKKY